MNPLAEFQAIPINCLWIDPETLIKTIIWMREEDETRNWIYSKRPLDLKSIYFPAPPSGGTRSPKFAVWQPSNMSFGSVLIPNSGDGRIQLMRHLNRRFQVRYFSARLARDHKKYGVCSFEHADEAGVRRVAYVILDRGWEFYDQGPILPFEKPVYYQHRRIADRLTPDIVIEYLKTLGWDLKDEAFWKSKGEAWVGEKTSFK